MNTIISRFPAPAGLPSPASPSQMQGLVAEFVRVAGVVARAVRREWRIRRDLRRISELDEHMLHDIGVSPGALEDAVRHGRDAGFHRGAIVIHGGFGNSPLGRFGR
jgi:uncharacterized protein YjiS (DUF1127 family)